jgi:hypothetical protein
VLCVVRSPPRADNPSRGGIPIVVCWSVIAKPRKRGGPGPLRGVAPWKKVYGVNVVTKYINVCVYLYSIILFMYRKYICHIKCTAGSLCSSIAMREYGGTAPLILLFLLILLFCGAGRNPTYRTSAFEAVCTLTPVLVPPFISRSAPRQTA